MAGPLPLTAYQELGTSEKSEQSVEATHCSRRTLGSERPLRMWCYFPDTFWEAGVLKPRAERDGVRVLQLEAKA